MQTQIVRKDGIAIRRPKKSLEANGVAEKVEDFLERHSSEAFTVMGLMVDVFDAEAASLNGSWKEWPSGMTTLYGRIMRSLEMLEKHGKVVSQKDGRAVWWSWNGS